MGVAINPWRRFPADPADWFSAEEIAKAKSYTRPLHRLNLAERAAMAGAMVAVVALQLAPELLEGLGVDNWVGRLLVTVVFLEVINVMVSVPFGAYRELVYDKRWGFSTQTARGFASDSVKQLAVGAVVGSALFVPLWAVIRATDLWWVYGWLVVAAIAVGIGLLAPVLIMPLFNKFTPLADDALREDLLGYAHRAGADVAEIQVSDASRRSRKDNAFVTGAGRTRRLVLFDTILARPREQIRAVAVHEIGHWKLRHVLRLVPLVVVLLFFNFLVTRLVLGWDRALSWAGVDTLEDPAVLPLFLLVFPLASAVTGLVSAWVTRAGERQADLFALEVTKDPDAMGAMLRALHTDNLADLAPSAWRRLNQSHPPAAERLALVDAWAHSDQSSSEPT